MSRPTVIDEATVLKLEEALKDGLSVSIACYLSGISRATFYKHLSENEEFSDKMTLAQQWMTERAREVVARAIDKGDVQAAKWWLERKNKEEFSLRYEAKVEQSYDETSHDALRQIAEAIMAANKDAQPTAPSGLN